MEQPEPTDEQQHIIGSEKDTLVVSNPGTGKTFTLAHRVLYLLETGANPDDILCITFTEKAKKEMHDAIYRHGKDKFASEIMKIRITTFHSLAYNYLVDEGKIGGDVISDDMRRFSVFKSIKKHNMFHYTRDYIINDVMPMVENAIHYIKSFGITPHVIDIDKTSKILEDVHDEKSTYTIEEMKKFLEYFVLIFKEYEEEKAGEVDYEDVLSRFLAECRGRKFKHVLIDEMQDMNKMEADIAKKIADGIFLVGDPKQAIFGFQGGSTRHFNEFEDTCTRMLLSKNRRNTREIVNYSKEYYQQNVDTNEKEQEDLRKFDSDTTGKQPVIISTKAVFANLQDLILEHYSDVTKIPKDDVLANLQDLIADNPDATIGIIARTNSQLVKMSKFLDAQSIPHVATASQATTETAKKEITNYLTGVFSRDVRDKILAAFTVFSPYSLQDAFDFCMKHKDSDGAVMYKLNSWGNGITRNNLDDMFDDVVFPICASKGPEWLSTATSIKQKINEYLAVGTPTLEEMLDYIATGEIESAEISASSTNTGITLTTIHKSKGREFDTVVYVPKTTGRKTFVDVTVTAILKSHDIDVQEELKGESARLDFVAFTRARSRLYIITDDKSLAVYHIENVSKITKDDRHDDKIPTVTDGRYAEAYSAFVAKRYSEAKRLLEDRGAWLEDHIKNYFENMDSISYSAVKTDPYEFLKSNIINMPFDNKSMEFGTNLHHAMHRILAGNANIQDYQEDLKEAIQNGLDAVDRLKKQYKGLEVHELEKKITVPLKAMTENDNDIMFSGKLDAVFKHDSGYLIVDYKTDKKTTRATEHKRQLWTYKKLLAISEDIEEEKIDAVVVFVSIKGSINTGKYDSEISESTKNTYPTFERHMQKVLEWKADYKKFIDDLLQTKSDELLYQVIFNKLIGTNSANTDDITNNTEHCK